MQWDPPQAIRFLKATQPTFPYLCTYLACCLTIPILITFQPLAWAGMNLVLLEHPQQLSFTGFASSLTTVGDLDGDNIPDYVVGAYQHFWNSNLKQGRAFVFSGRDGQLLQTLDLPHPRQGGGSGATPFSGASFGWAVASAGDMNQDGAPDLLIGASNQDESGEVYVFSGKTGALLSTLHAPQRQQSAGFGWSVASLGDLTGDTIPELIVGAFAYDGIGRAFVFNGKDNSVLWILKPPSSESSAFGWSVIGAGDLDQDGTPDMVVGAPYTSVGETSAQGRAYAFSGRTGTLLYTIEDPHPRAGAVFGWCVAAGGDYNGDGVPDMLIGAPYKDTGTIRAEGEAFVFNGADGSLLLTLHNPAPTKSYSGFGLALTASPDINQDGVPEILVGAPFQTVDQFQIQGEAFLFDGRSGKHLSTFDNPSPHQGSMFGYTLAAPGDVNGDHIPDFAIGTAGQTIRDKAAVGRVYLFLSRA
ncbi:MAG: integrin alpha, partial [Candidatus Binatia bacterium]